MGLEMPEMSFQPPSFAQHFSQTPPDVLYHYTDQAGLLGIIGTHELWATKIQYMNDATEFGLALAMARRQLENTMQRLTSTSEKAACVQLRESLSGLEDVNIFAACFCQDGDLLSQWRGYSGDGQGYAIAFDSRALTKLASVGNFTVGKCIYDTELQYTILKEAIEHCVKGEADFSQTGRRWALTVRSRMCSLDAVDSSRTPLFKGSKSGE